ncbi:MAG: hypothetical protein Q4G64_01150 [bacterium]|nr:hypothetical protein [bacterium]
MCTRRATTRWATCPCDRCRRIASRTTKSARLGLLPASRSDEAWAELDAMLARGWSTAAIASACDVAQPTIDNAVRQRERTGHATSFHYGTAEKILAHGEPTRGEVSSEGSRRRLRALAVMGWTLAELSERSGLHRRTLSTVRADDSEHVKVETAATISALFDSIGLEPGTSEVIARDARAKGWIGPLGWDDIDDLEERGDAAEVTARRARRPFVDAIAVERVVEGGRAAPGAAPELGPSERDAAISALATRGHSNGEIASRIGVSIRTVLRHRNRLGLPAYAA